MPVKSTTQTPLQPKSLPTLEKLALPSGKDYVITVPEPVERMIRTFCDMSPRNEWSGVLFYTVEGDFESPKLEVVCKDILLMDIGSSAYTVYDFSNAEVGDYIGENPELIDCYTGLIHSHQNFGTFFSGTDTDTLRKEGSDLPNFVSLIVNNAGEYSAAITRKVTYQSTIHTEKKGSYPWYAQKTVEVPETVMDKSIQEVVIQYYELKINKATVVEDAKAKQFNKIREKKGLLSFGESSRPSYQSYSSYQPPYQNSKPSETDTKVVVADTYQQALSLWGYGNFMWDTQLHAFTKNKDYVATAKEILKAGETTRQRAYLSDDEDDDYPALPGMTTYPEDDIDFEELATMMRPDNDLMNDLMLKLLTGTPLASHLTKSNYSVSLGNSLVSKWMLVCSDVTSFSDFYTNYFTFIMGEENVYKYYRHSDIVANSLDERNLETLLCMHILEEIEDLEMNAYSEALAEIVQSACLP